MSVKATREEGVQISSSFADVKCEWWPIPDEEGEVARPAAGVPRCAGVAVARPRLVVQGVGEDGMMGSAPRGPVDR